MKWGIFCRQIELMNQSFCRTFTSICVGGSLVKLTNENAKDDGSGNAPADLTDLN